MYSLTQMLDRRLSSVFPLWGILLLYLCILGVLAIAALKKKWLTVSGTAGAVVFGLLVLYISGFSGFAVFFFFFLTCSLVSKVKKSHNNKEKKGSVRDLEQVIANGLPGILCLLGYRIFPQLGNAAFIAFSASIAEAMADTWSGTLGIMSNRPPVSILTFTPVPKGISGGVTPLGFLGGAVGAMLIALVHIGTFGPGFQAFLIICGTGFLGSVIDSFLGAMFQEQYRAKDGSLTEKDTEGEEKLERVRGFPGFDNDMVNLVSGLFSALAALSLALIVG